MGNINCEKIVSLRKLNEFSLRLDAPLCGVSSRAIQRRK